MLDKNDSATKVLNTKSEKSKIVLKYFGYFIVILLFSILILKADFHNIIDHIKKIPLKTMLLLMLLQLITQLFLALQWHGIAAVVLGKSSFFKMFYILTTGSVIEAITPGAKIGGELTRHYYLKKEFDAKPSLATNIIIIQKSISMSVLFIICFASFIYLQKMVATNFSVFLQIAVEVFCVLTVLFMLCLLFCPKQLEKLFKKGKSKFAIKMFNWVKSYSQTTKLLSKKQWVWQFIISFIVWILFPIKMVILSLSMNIEMHFLIVVAITMTSYMFGMLPLTPGGIGTFEGVMTLILSMLSVSSSVALTISIVFRFITFWLVIFASTLFVLIYRKVVVNDNET